MDSGEAHPLRCKQSCLSAASERQAPPARRPELTGAAAPAEARPTRALQWPRPISPVQTQPLTSLSLTLCSVEGFVPRPLSPPPAPRHPALACPRSSRGTDRVRNTRYLSAKYPQVSPRVHQAFTTVDDRVPTRSTISTREPGACPATHTDNGQLSPAHLPKRRPVPPPTVPSTVPTCREWTVASAAAAWPTAVAEISTIGRYRPCSHTFSPLPPGSARPSTMYCT